MIHDAVQSALEIARTGALRHDGPGRTDDLEISVPGESFVIPADVVSSLGEGNTAHGLKVLERMFPPSLKPQRAAGGAVPIVAAGGEFIIGPEHVRRVGGGDMKKGHDALRRFVLLARKKAIKDLKSLPSPVKG